MENPFKNRDLLGQEKDPKKSAPDNSFSPKEGAGYSFQAKAGKAPKKKKSRFTLWLILILLVIIAGLVAFIYFSSEKRPDPVKSTTLKDQLTSAQDLATTKYLYTNLGSYESQKDFQGIKLPFTKKKFLVRYNGTIAAGIDLKDLKVDVRGRVIHITLPPAKILSHELDEDSFEIFNEEASIFNPFMIRDFQDFQKKLKEQKEGEAVRQGLLIRAQERSILVLRQLLMANPNIAENYSVDFTYSDGTKPLPSFTPEPAASSVEGMEKN